MKKIMTMVGIKVSYAVCELQKDKICGYESILYGIEKKVLWVDKCEWFKIF